MSKPEAHWIDDDAECPNCGGEGVIYECIDGFCKDAEWGCDDCVLVCECQKRQASVGLQDVLREALEKAKH